MAMEMKIPISPLSFPAVFSFIHKGFVKSMLCTKQTSKVSQQDVKSKNILVSLHAYRQLWKGNLQPDSRSLKKTFQSSSRLLVLPYQHVV